jgi:ABC-type dipeptide/oligopeptide/nickel transport system permease component
MARFIIRRLLLAIPTIFGILLLTFLLQHFSPGDPVHLMLAGQFDVTPEERDALAESLGLNDPLPVQFARYVKNAVTLDFGDSFYYHRPALSMILERVPNSLQLTILSILLAISIGVPLGVISAYNRGRLTDHAIRIFSTIGHAVPSFWFGLLFVTILGVELRWFPIGSMNAIGKEGDVIDRIWHLVGPVITASLAGIALYPRYLRTEVLEIIRQDYVRTATAKGLAERSVRWVHVLRNCLIPIVTLFGGILTVVLAGSLVIEQVFNWPGLGRLIFEALTNKDYPVIQADVLAVSFLLLVSFILRDIAYAWVDPRIKVTA